MYKKKPELPSDERNVMEMVGSSEWIFHACGLLLMLVMSFI